MDNLIKSILRRGRPVLLALSWNVKKPMTNIHTNLGYDFLLTEPKDLRTFETDYDEDEKTSRLSESAKMPMFPNFTTRCQQESIAEIWMKITSQVTIK